MAPCLTCGLGLRGGLGRGIFRAVMKIDEKGRPHVKEWGRFPISVDKISQTDLSKFLFVF